MTSISKRTVRQILEDYKDTFTALAEYDKKKENETNYDSSPEANTASNEKKTS